MVLQVASIHAKPYQPQMQQRKIIGRFQKYIFRRAARGIEAVVPLPQKPLYLHIDQIIRHVPKITAPQMPRCFISPALNSLRHREQRVQGVTRRAV